MAAFQIGDKVTWVSQSGSYTKAKAGVVFALVPAGKRPDTTLRGLQNCGLGRDHESYVIKVKTMYYWPKVSYLQKISNKTVSTVPEYQITLNKDQLDALIAACECFFRMGLAQYHYAFDVATKIPLAKIQDVRLLCDQLHGVITGLQRGQSFGISSEDLSEPHRLVHDLQQVFRHRMAWDGEPKGGHTVRFQTPFKIGDQPMAKIKRTDTDMTLDGWCWTYPTEPGSYELRIADANPPSINHVKIKKIPAGLLVTGEETGKSMMLTDLPEGKFQWRRSKIKDADKNVEA
jgi:hypothetical protein